MNERTSVRFKNEIKREPIVLEYSFKFYPWLKAVVKNYKEDNTAFHDAKVFLNNSKAGFVEIQITHYGENDKEGYRRYGDVRLDLISSFELSKDCYNNFLNNSQRWKFLKNKEHLKKFTSLYPVKKWGKLITCDADLFYFAVLDNADRCYLLNIYDNKKLKSQVNYFINKFGIKINHKIGESWGSAFVPVNESDKVLRNCLINGKEDFLRVF